jgi:pyrroline-5-carboxylate reductase
MDLTNTSIVLAGFGNMGRALASGWRDGGIDPASITVVDPAAEARAQACAQGCQAVAAPEEVAAPIDVAVLAVKPATIESVLGMLPTAALYLSIAAGRSIGDIAACVGSEAAIVRAMPNTPAAIGRGITVGVGNARAGASARKLAHALLSATGGVEWVKDEALMDAVTAVSGSGPAYIFLLAEAMARAGVAAGLPPALADRLARETVAGSGELLHRSTLPAATLRTNVTSPGGTTAAALDVLMAADGLGPLMTRAILAAARRGKELAG